MNGGNGTYGSWAIYNNGSSSFDHVTATNMTASTVTATNITANDLYANNGGTIAGWTIGANSLTSNSGNMVINSSGSMSGPGWWIDSNGNASFANSGGGSFSAGGGSSVNGGFSCGAGGGGAWGGPAATMDAKTITLYTRLGLKKSSFSAVGDGHAHIPANMQSLSDAVKIKAGPSTTVYGNISGSVTIDGHSGSISNGRCWIDIPTYILEYNNLASVPIAVVDIGSVIVTDWNKKDTTTADFLCSKNPDQDFQDG